MPQIDSKKQRQEATAGIFDPQARNQTLLTHIVDRGKEGTVEVLTTVLEKLDDLESRIDTLQKEVNELKLKP